MTSIALIVMIACAGTFPYEVNLLNFSPEEHTLRIMVVDSRGMTDLYQLTFVGVEEEDLPSEFVKLSVPNLSLQSVCTFPPTPGRPPLSLLLTYVHTHTHTHTHKSYILICTLMQLCLLTSKYWMTH